MQSCAPLSWQAHSDSAASSRQTEQGRGQDRDQGLRTGTRTRTKPTRVLRYSQINTEPVGDNTDWGSVGQGVRQGASSVMTKRNESGQEGVAWGMMVLPIGPEIGDVQLRATDD